MEDLDYLSAKQMTVNELREKMKERGYDSAGTKKKLLNRLRYYSNPNRSRKAKFSQMMNDPNDNDQHLNLDFEPSSKKRKLNDNNSNSNSNALPQLSIQDVPKDIIQYILSFDDSTDTHLVNKEWYQLFKLNERKQIKKWISDYTKTFNPNIAVNNTLIVDPTRQKLTDEEQKSGFQGPYQDLSSVFHECQSGDKILLYPGNYSFDNHAWHALHARFLFHGIELQIIGMDDNVYIDSIYGMQLRCCNEFGYHGRIYFEKINFKIPSTIQTFDIMSYHHTSVWIQDCAIHADTVRILNGGTIRILNTRFLDCINNVESAILFWGADFVDVIGCEFRNVMGTKACISCERIKGQARIIGNVFKNVHSHPICCNGDTAVLKMHGNLIN